MRIRISDMLDNASELIEENREVRNTTNNDRIKKMASPLPLSDSLLIRALLPS